MLRKKTHTIITQKSNGKMPLRSNERNSRTSKKIYTQIQRMQPRSIQLRRRNNTKRHTDNNRTKQRQMGNDVLSSKKGQIRENTSKGIHKISQSIQRNIHRKPESNRPTSKPRHERTLPMVMGIDRQWKIIRSKTRNKRQNTKNVRRTGRNLPQDTKQMVGSLPRGKNSPHRGSEPRSMRTFSQLFQDMARRVCFRGRSKRSNST